MFSSINNWFNKKNEEPKELNIKDLTRGCFLDYDMITWEVVEVGEYDWGDQFFTVEYTLTDGKDFLFLHVEEDAGIELTLSKAVNIRKINPQLPSIITKNNEPPDEIEFEGKNYFLDSENPGYFRNQDAGRDQWTEFIAWDYFDETEKHTLSIEQWGEKSFEASTGMIIQKHQISNLLPNPTKK